MAHDERCMTWPQILRATAIALVVTGIVAAVPQTQHLVMRTSAFQRSIGLFGAPSDPDFRATSAAVRQFDDVLNRLADRYTVIDNIAFYADDHVLYWQLRFAEAFNNTVIGLGGQRDERSRLGERHPRYRFWRSHVVANVSGHCYTLEPTLAPGSPDRKWVCSPLPFIGGTRYANVYEAPAPTPNGDAWIEPILPGEGAASLFAERTASQHVSWGLAPLQDADLVRLGPLMTAGLSGTHRPFLAFVVGYRATYYLLWLPFAREAGDGR
jgi:hypothetical protein